MFFFFFYPRGKNPLKTNRRFLTLHTHVLFLLRTIYENNKNHNTAVLKPGTAARAKKFL